mmetsp:Transcript_55092/g.128942  ORF Transcript_55092/g.128942 Transcript_55092/m.128942 type:complete len:216 (+) Transcript_55092:850-1497(+)
MSLSLGMPSDMKLVCWVGSSSLPYPNIAEVGLNTSLTCGDSLPLGGSVSPSSLSSSISPTLLSMDDLRAVLPRPSIGEVPAGPHAHLAKLSKTAVSFIMSAPSLLNFLGNRGQRFVLIDWVRASLSLARSLMDASSIACAEPVDVLFPTVPRRNCQGRLFCRMSFSSADCLTCLSNFQVGIDVSIVTGGSPSSFSEELPDSAVLLDSLPVFVDSS